MSASTSEARDLGVYIHVPFCERICPYCDFAVEAVGTLDAALEDETVGLLLRELELVRAELGPALEGRRLATVYIGGGTPSLLRAASIERLLAGLRAAFPGEPCEITLELNPGLPEVRRAREFKSAGVTRVSLGVQSLQDSTLKRLGRGHGAAEARAGLEACLSAGFASLSVDLIHGAPEQEEEALIADARLLGALGVPHVSAYALTLEPGTPFAKAADAGRLPLPDEDRALRLWRLVRSMLTAGGAAQYEISSFARRGHRARHNTRYWQRRPVLGLGVSAASLIDERRFRNPRGRGEWASAVAAGRVAFAEDERLDVAEARRETLGLGLRLLRGVGRADYVRRFGAPPEAHFGPELRELRGLRLIEDAAARIRLTERGLLFADDVFMRFVAAR